MAIFIEIPDEVDIHTRPIDVQFHGMCPLPCVQCSARIVDGMANYEKYFVYFDSEMKQVNDITIN